MNNEISGSRVPCCRIEGAFTPGLALLCSKTNNVFQINLHISLGSFLCSHCIIEKRAGALYAATCLMQAGPTRQWSGISGGVAGEAPGQQPDGGRTGRGFKSGVTGRRLPLSPALRLRAELSTLRSLKTLDVIESLHLT